MAHYRLIGRNRHEIQGARAAAIRFKLVWTTLIEERTLF